jgi:hypothetical protein
MIERWKPVNLTKRQYISPQSFGCGDRLDDWNAPDSPVMNRAQMLVLEGRWSLKDQMVLASDQRGLLPFLGSCGKEVPNDIHDIAVREYEDVALENVSAKKRRR